MAETFSGSVFMIWTGRGGGGKVEETDDLVGRGRKVWMVVKRERNGEVR